MNKQATTESLTHRSQHSNRFVPHTLAATRHNLRQLATIRMLVLLFMGIATIYGLNTDELRSARFSVLIIIAVQSLITLATFIRLNAKHPISENAFFLQLLIDVAFISFITFFTGGATNPFVSYYLVPISIAAATISGSRVASIALLSIIAYTLLLFFYQPLDFFSHSGQNLGLGLYGDTASDKAANPAAEPVANVSTHQHDHHSSMGNEQATPIQAVFNAHYLGMWFNFLVSAVLIAWFVARMAQTVREQDQAINLQRESQLYDEQILSIATIAAGTAHELGTPLNTLQLLIDDFSASGKLKLEQGHLSKEEADEINVMQTQIEACRLALSKLSNTAQQTQPGEKQSIAIVDFVDQAVENWLPLRPEVNLLRSYQHSANISTIEGTNIVCDPSLSQALINLLNNAANASPDFIDLDIQFESLFVNIVIVDRGKGIADEIVKNSGQLTPLNETKRQEKGSGMGLGLFLSNASIHRHGGTLILKNAIPSNKQTKEADKTESTGAIVTMRLPLLVPSPT